MTQICLLGHPSVLLSDKGMKSKTDQWPFKSNGSSLKGLISTRDEREFSSLSGYYCWDICSWDICSWDIPQIYYRPPAKLQRSKIFSHICLSVPCPPPELFKLVHYVACISTSKRAVGLQLKGLLVLLETSTELQDHIIYMQQYRSIRIYLTYHLTSWLSVWKGYIMWGKPVSH